ncbi:MAG: glycosyltransferase family 4 protein [Nibricoccus sp.]
MLIYTGISAIVCSALVAFIVRKAPVLGLVDRPNERSSHTKVTPRGGGVGIVATWCIGLIASWCLCEIHLSTFQIVTLATTALGIAGVSLRDDFRSVGPGIRLGVHLVAAVVVIKVFGAFEVVQLGFEFQLGWLGAPLTVLWIVGLTNVFNFMDGIDGIAGLQGATAGFFWAGVGLSVGAQGVAVMGALLAGGCIGFLCHNWSPAKIFMGDVGSAFLGFCFGILPIIALQELSSQHHFYARLPTFAIMALWPFLADGLFTFFRRVANHEPVWKAHRTHLYQRMVQGGGSHSAVATYYCLWNIICSIVALKFVGSGGILLAASIAMLFVVVTWILTVLLERGERSM